MGRRQLLLLLAGCALLAAQTRGETPGDEGDEGDESTAPDADDAGADNAEGGEAGGGADAGGGEAGGGVHGEARVEDSTMPLDSSALEMESETSTKQPIAILADLTQYRLKSRNGETCILMEMDAVVEVHYETKSKENRDVSRYVGTMPQPRGYCGDDEAHLIIEWKEFRLRWNFLKTPGGERWYVNLVELQYDKSESLFENASSVGETTLSTRRAHGTMLFPTPVGKSFHCQSEYTLTLNSDNGGSDYAKLLLRQLRMQPFMYKDNFGPEFECNPGGLPKMRDETAPIAVGSTLAVVVLLTVTGYGVYRYFKIKKVQYDTME